MAKVCSVQLSKFQRKISTFQRLSVMFVVIKKFKIPVEHNIIVKQQYSPCLCAMVLMHDRPAGMCMVWSWGIVIGLIWCGCVSCVRSRGRVACGRWSWSGVFVDGYGCILKGEKGGSFFWLSENKNWKLKHKKQNRFQRVHAYYHPHHIFVKQCRLTDFSFPTWR